MDPNPNPPPIVAGPLSPGAIAGIVIGCLVGFLLLCALLFCAVFCCCFSSRACCLPCCCCCAGVSRAAKDSSLVSSSGSDMKYGVRRVSELEESQSGFKDAHKIRPNYVSNTVSKAGSVSYVGRDDSEFVARDGKYLFSRGLIDVSFGF